MSIKKIAWNFLLDNNVSEFRIDLDNLIKIVRNNGYRIASYDKSSGVMEKLNIPDEFKDSRGFTYVYSGNSKNEYFIFFKPDLSYEDKIYVILHEIGHIMSGHTYCQGLLGDNNDDAVYECQELEADMFAFEVLAPSHILNKLEKDTAEEVKNISILSYENALNYITELHKYKHDDEDLSELKNRLSKQYKKYMNTVKKNEFKKVMSKNPYIKKTFCGVVLVAIISIFINVYVYNRRLEPKDPTEITDLSSPKETEIDPYTLPAISSLDEVTQEDTTASDSNALDNSISNNLVYVTSSGKKYHIKGCRYVKNKTNIKELSIKDALDLKYQPCSVCIK